MWYLYCSLSCTNWIHFSMRISDDWNRSYSQFATRRITVLLSWEMRFYCGNIVVFFSRVSLHVLCSACFIMFNGDIARACGQCRSKSPDQNNEVVSDMKWANSFERNHRFCNFEMIFWCLFQRIMYSFRAVETIIAVISWSEWILCAGMRNIQWELFAIIVSFISPFLSQFFRDTGDCPWIE